MIPYVGWETKHRVPTPTHEPAPSYDACPDAIVEDWPGHGRHDWVKDGRTVKCRGYRLPDRGAVFPVPPDDPRYGAHTDDMLGGRTYPGNRSPGAGYAQ